MQRAVERAVHRVNSVNAVDGGAFFFWGYEAHGDVDASDDEHSVFEFDFSLTSAVSLSLLASI